MIVDLRLTIVDWKIEDSVKSNINVVGYKN